MNISFAFVRLSINQRTTFLPLCWVSLLLLPGLLAAQQAPLVEREPPVEQEPFPEQQELSDPEVSPIPPDTHASQRASTELMTMAANQPEIFIGKTLVLDDGNENVRVGPVLDLRRRLQDEELYLIVDAAAYFNTPVRYAVAVKDVDKMEADTLIIPEAQGMHLNGLDYYPDDYTDVAETDGPAGNDRE